MKRFFIKSPLHRFVITASPTWENLMVIEDSSSGEQTEFLLDIEQRKRISLAIKFYRVKAEMTQQALGDKIGMTQQAIWRLENTYYASSNLERLKKIAAALNHPLEKFMIKDAHELS